MYDVSNEVFMTFFGYIPYKRVFLTELDTGEYARYKNKNMVLIHRLIWEMFSKRIISIRNE